MAKRKTQSRPKHPFYLDPLGKLADLSFGVLRSTYRGQTNSVAAYATAKRGLCSRSEVLLPAEAPDSYLDPDRLWGDFEAAKLPRQQDLAICLTLYLPGLRTLHAGWEEVRAYAHGELVTKRALPVELVLHAPGLAASAHDPHVHVIAAARRLHGWGWGPFADLCRDQGQQAVWDSWTAHRAGWGRAA